MSLCAQRHAGEVFTPIWKLPHGTRTSRTARNGKPRRNELGVATRPPQLARANSCAQILPRLEVSSLRSRNRDRQRHQGPLARMQTVEACLNKCRAGPKGGSRYADERFPAQHPSKARAAESHDPNRSAHHYRCGPSLPHLITIRLLSLFAPFWLAPEGSTARSESGRVSSKTT